MEESPQNLGSFLQKGLGFPMTLLKNPGTRTNPKTSTQQVQPLGKDGPHRGLMDRWTDGFPKVEMQHSQDVATMDRWISADIVPLGHNLILHHFENVLES